MSTNDHKELAFETEICEHLAANGWQYSPNSSGYDKTRALFPEDVFTWLEETQPLEFAKVVKIGDVQEPKQREQLLDVLRATLERPHSAGGGTIAALRNGFQHRNAKFTLAQFKPETTDNPTTLERYERMRLRVVRQVYYSTAGKSSIDLVLFVNGIPVATLELKTDFTQSISEAIHQYKQDRNPKNEPLLTPFSGALVHFAVSNSDVYMTTNLAGLKTRFLPFNLGHEHGAGNPANPNGSKTAYLWERILQRDTWLDILGKFVFVKEETHVDSISGKRTTTAAVRFPRLHQWDVVTKLVETSREEGAGNRYLIEHSAGSGKTDSISWTANRLASLHNHNNEPVFDSVIIITDRTVLDRQLQKAIRQIESKPGLIATIDDEAIRDAGKGSKSAVLAEELLKGTRIIVVTIQTFPYAMDAIRETKGLAHKRFAIIADEAHSSQTGQTANKVKAVLSSEELAELEDGGEIDTESVLASETASRADSSNISYYAFTATPKPKTLELFGRKVGDGKPEPFHRYTMKQAIEEGYILDVLRGYQSYSTAFQIAKRATKEPQNNGASANGTEELVDQKAATRGLMRWVELHPTNIAQKVSIIVEHFRSNVAHLLDGHAKAMVVTSSRKSAARYKQSIDAYIAKMDYDIGTIVAFSGGVTDEEFFPGSKEDPLTEANMNPNLRGQEIPTAFQSDQYQILLVANKFQTGFDQPLLSAMYVDKRLSGVTAVQTLSRMNRTYTTPSGEMKSVTMVLDFVNDPEEIRTSFEPYFKGAYLETETDPNVVHALVTKLNYAGIYTQEEVDKAADAAVRHLGNNALSAATAPGAARFHQQYNDAIKRDDKSAIDELEMFRKDVGSFVRIYDFMSQILDYEDPELEKRSIYLRLLQALLETENHTDDIDLTGVTLTHIKQIDHGKTNIKLGTDQVGLQASNEVGTGGKHDPEMVAFARVIERLNELFGDEDFTSNQKVSFLEVLLNAILENEVLTHQILANSKSQFLESPFLRDGVLDAVADNQNAHNRIAETMFGDGQLQHELVKLVGEAVYERVRISAL